jgi:hypothetical protein
VRRGPEGRGLGGWAVLSVLLFPCRPCGRVAGPSPSASTLTPLAFVAYARYVPEFGAGPPPGPRPPGKQSVRPYDHDVQPITPFSPSPAADTAEINARFSPSLEPPGPHGGTESPRPGPGIRSKWAWLKDEPKPIQQAESLSGVGKKYSEVWIQLRAPRGNEPGPSVALWARSTTQPSKLAWLALPDEYRNELAGIGIDVMAQEAESAIGAHLGPATPLDTLVDIAGILLEPQTQVPALLGMLVEVAAIHAGFPLFVARWAGEAVEQAISPVFQSTGGRAEVVTGLDAFSVTCDLSQGQVTSAVVNLAVNHLADELKSRLS